MVKQGDHWGVQLQVPSDGKPTDWGCTAPDGTSTQTANGWSCFYPDKHDGTWWVQLLVLSRFDLHLISNDDINCQTATSFPQEHAFDVEHGGSDPNSANTNPCIVTLVKKINSFNDGDLVIAVSQPGDKPQLQPPVGVAAALSGKFIAPYGHNLGINASNWFDAPNNGANLPPATRGTFSAIGVPGWTTGGIAKLAASPDQSGLGGELVADVALDNNNRYSPLVPVSAKDGANSPITKVLTQDPAPWPGSSNAGEMAAMSAIGASSTVNLTSDPRSQFYANPQSDAAWLSDQNAIDKLSYQDVAGAGHSCNNPLSAYSCDDFNWAKTELSQEIREVIKVDSYLLALSRPYGVAEKSQWGTFEKVKSEIDSATANGTSALVVGLAGEVLEAALEAIPVFGEAIGKAADVVASAYHFAMAVGNYANVPADSSFDVVSGDLAAELTNRFNDAEQEIELGWRRIILADYGKLHTVYLCSQSNAACAEPSPNWAVTTDTMPEAAKALTVGFARTLYTTLVPVKYPLALALTYSPTIPGLVTTSIPNAATWCRPLRPFQGTTGLYMDAVHGTTLGTHLIYHVPIALTTGNTTKTWQAASWTVFTRMFDPIDPGSDLTTGGLGINEHQFIDSAYHPTYDERAEPVTTDHFAASTHFVSLWNCHW